mgnify:FL=1
MNMLLRYPPVSLLHLRVYLPRVAWVALSYFLLGKLSYTLLPATNSLLESLFLPEGFGLALALLLGSWVGAGVFAGHFVLTWSNDFPWTHAALTGACNALVLLVGAQLLRRCQFRRELATARDYLLLVLVTALVLQPLSRVLGWWLLSMDTGEGFQWLRLNEAMELGAVEKSACEVLVVSAILAFVDVFRTNGRPRFWLYLALAAAALGIALQRLLFDQQAVHLHALQVISLLYLLVMLTTAVFELAGAVLSCLAMLAMLQWAAQTNHGAFFQLVGFQDGEYYFNVFLAGIVFSAGLLGALLREKSANEAKLAELAHQDYLTGISNRRYFCDLATRELARVKRGNASVALLWIDIDHFKQINDQHGHAVGDDVLVFFAGVLQRETREADVVARIGGEEFAAMALDVRELDALAERFRSALQHALAARPGIVPFTVSIGATLFRVDDADIDVAFHRADVALYQAKQGGRNRAVCAP